MITKNQYVKSKKNAKIYIEKYFFSNNFFDEKINDEKYCNLCIAEDITSATKKAYEAISQSQMFKEDTGFCPIEKDVKFIIGILAKMSKIVPQEYSAGMLLLHLKFIEKMENLGI